MNKHSEQQWSDSKETFNMFNKCFHEPYLEITQLFSKAMNNILNNNIHYAEQCLTIKNQAELVALNMEIINKNWQEIIGCSQELWQSMAKNFSHASETMQHGWKDMSSNIAKTSEVMQSTMTGKKGKTKSH